MVFTRPSSNQLLETTQRFPLKEVRAPNDSSSKCLSPLPHPFRSSSLTRALAFLAQGCAPSSRENLYQIEEVLPPRRKKTQRPPRCGDSASVLNPRKKEWPFLLSLPFVVQVRDLSRLSLLPFRPFSLYPLAFRSSAPLSCAAQCIEP